VKAERERGKLLKQHGFVLVRQSCHKIYRNQEGKVFVTPATPSDQRGIYNSLSDLKRILAQPPMCELLAIADHERREKLRREQRAAQEAAQALAKKHNGGGYGKGHGTGYAYYDAGVMLTDEERAAQAERRRQDKEDDRLARQEGERLAALGKTFVEEQLAVEFRKLEQVYGKAIAFFEYAVENYEAVYDLADSFAKKYQAADSVAKKAIEAEMAEMPKRPSLECTPESAAHLFWIVAHATGSNDREFLRERITSGRDCTNSSDFSARSADMRNVLRLGLIQFWRERVKHGSVSEHVQEKIKSRIVEGLAGLVFPTDPKIDFASWAAAANRLLEQEPAPDAQDESAGVVEAQEAVHA